MGKAKEVSNQINKLIIKTVEKMSYRRISDFYDVSKPEIKSHYQEILLALSY